LPQRGVNYIGTILSATPFLLHANTHKHHRSDASVQHKNNT